MGERFAGNIEIFHDDESTGLTGLQWCCEDVPTVVAVLYGVRELAEEPPAERHGRTPAGEWTGRDADGRAVRVLLWRDVPFSDTAIGQAMAAAASGGFTGPLRE